MADDITIPVKATGTDEAARGLDKVADSAKGLGTAADKVSPAIGQMRQGLSAVGQSLGALSPQLGQATSLIGNLTQSIGSATTSAGLLGVGLAAGVGAFTAWAQAMNEPLRKLDEFKTRLLETTANLGQLTNAIIASQNAQARTQALVSGQTGSDQERQALRQAMTARALALAFQAQSGNEGAARQLRDLQAQRRQLDESLRTGGTVTIEEGTIEQYDPMQDANDRAKRDAAERPQQRRRRGGGRGRGGGIARAPSGPSLDDLMGGTGRGGGIDREDQGRALYGEGANLEIRSLIDSKAQEKEIRDKALEEEKARQEQYHALYEQGAQAGISAIRMLTEGDAASRKKRLADAAKEEVFLGLAATAIGVGNVIFNPPGAASKFAEAGIHFALAATYGVGSAVTKGGGAGGGKAERPTRMNSGNNDMAGNGAPIIVNMNAPVITAGTNNEVARMLVRETRRGLQRFGEDL